MPPVNSSIRQDRREEVLETVVDYMLDSGLGNMSLRALASAVGTSDRMLLYYFEDKNDLMLSAFECFVQRLAERLSEMLPAGRQPFDVLLRQMWLMLKAPEYEPYVRIWYAALGHASHGEELYRSMTNRVVDEWLEFFASRLKAPPEQRRDQIAALVAAACGLVMMRYIGRADEAEVAADVLTRKVRGSARKAKKSGAAVTAVRSGSSD
jgi:AcrR family transcriptional regulator